MGFADYLSRHPNSPPTDKNMNENHFINIITAVKYDLHSKHRKLTNQNAQYIDAQNDVKKHFNWNEQKQSAFCHSRANKQSLSNSLSNYRFKHSTQPKHYQTSHNFKHNISSLLKVHIAKQRRPHLDTNTVPITRRHRAPNKTKMELPIGDPTNNTNTIST